MSYKLIPSQLVRMGLTTKDQEHFGALQMARNAYEQRRFCSSLTCTTDPTGLRKTAKSTKRDACPDCGHTLFIKTVRVA